MPDREAAQRLNGDRQDEPEKHRGEDLSEFPDAKRSHQHSGNADGDHQTARGHGPSRQGLGVGVAKRIHGASDSLDGVDPAALGGLDEGFVVLAVLVGVPIPERRERGIGGVCRAEVGRDGHRVA